MLGDSRAARAKVSGDLTNCEPIVTQESKDLSASGISYDTENRVFPPVFSSNHLVTNMVTDRLQMSTLGKINAGLSRPAVQKCPSGENR